MTIGVKKNSNLLLKMSTFSLNFTYTYTIKGSNSHLSHKLLFLTSFWAKSP